jgi:hypothetical protein
MMDEGDMRRTYIEDGVANAHWHWVVELGHTCGVNVCQSAVMKLLTPKPFSKPTV